jgi:hypothetical protein
MTYGWIDTAMFSYEGYEAAFDEALNIDGLRQQALTLRQRVFVRLLRHVERSPREGEWWFVSFTYWHRSAMADAAAWRFEVMPRDSTSLPSLMAACYRNRECRAALAELPFIGRQRAADPELRETLQELADAVAWEGSEAFSAAYYPGVEEVEPLGPDHIRDIMQGMQREMDREGVRVSRQAARFEDLPPDRQRALAERRRMWFARFGITPERWKRGTFSVWEVNSHITWPPEGLYLRWGT